MAELRLQIDEPWFTYIEQKRKKIEGRKNNQKYIDMVGQDVIIFNKNNEELAIHVDNIIVYDNIEKYLKTEGLDKTLPGIKTIQEAKEIYLGFKNEKGESVFSDKKVEDAGGFIAIHFHLI